MSTRKQSSSSSSSSSSSLPPLTRLGKDVGKPKRQRVLMPNPLIANEDDLIGYPEDDPVDYRDEAEFADFLSVAQTSASTAVSNAAVEPVPTALRIAVSRDLMEYKLYMRNPIQSSCYSSLLLRVFDAGKAMSVRA